MREEISVTQFLDELYDNAKLHDRQGVSKAQWRYDIHRGLYRWAGTIPIRMSPGIFEGMYDPVPPPAVPEPIYIEPEE